RRSTSCPASPATRPTCDGSTRTPRSSRPARTCGCARPWTARAAGSPSAATGRSGSVGERVARPSYCGRLATRGGNMRRLTAALLALIGVLALAGCSDGAGAEVRSPRFTRAVLAALDGGGHAPYGTGTRYAEHGDTVSLWQRRFPPCSAWAKAPYPSDRRVLGSADGFATDGTRQIYRTITVYPSTPAAKRW